MSRYVITVEFGLAETGADTFRRLILENAAASLRNEPGCERFDVLTDPKDPLRVTLYEIYRDEAAFGEHLASAHFAAFDAASKPLVTTKVVTRLELLSRDGTSDARSEMAEA